VRVAIVNDMPMAVEFLKRIVRNSSVHELAWIARDGLEAVERCAEDTPDLILMDLVMPVMNGADATRQIMKTSPCPILVVTSSVGGNQSLAFEALGAGAMDVVKTPDLMYADDDGPGTLLDKINNIERLVRLDRSISNSNRKRRESARSGKSDLIVGIGASTGGPAAIVEVLSSIPAGLRATIVLILHIDQQFAAGMAEWMNGLVEMPVAIAEEGERPRMGTVVLAATNEHLVMTTEQVLRYTPEPRDYPYRPSADTFFSSLAANWHGTAAGIVLTGMGKDGSKGLLAMRNRGWHTIAQDKETSIAYGMPKAAFESGAAERVLPLERIGPAIVQLAPAVATQKA